MIKKEINLPELKKIQIDILNCVADYCEKNSINYFLACGTLLGSVRHGGYIPWDDDIDICMLRKDFNLFINSFNSFSHRYKCYSIDNNKSFYTPYAKVLDLQTILREEGQAGIEGSINIDIFVYDNAPDNDKTVKKMFKKRDIYRTLSNCRRESDFSSYSFYKRILLTILHYLLFIFPRHYFIKKISDNSKRYINLATKRVGNFLSYSKKVFDKHIFEDYEYGMFEGKKYRIPIGYNEYLNNFYGNYMELPPESKRVSHHAFKAYWK